MTVDLGLLTKAAEKWDEAAKYFETVQKTYDGQVKSVGLDGSWTGEANLMAVPTMQQTSNQYTAAAKEARAIASLLRDAQEQFTDLRNKLKSTVAEAEKAGMKVSEQGNVVASIRLDSGARHDPDSNTEAYRKTMSEAAAAEKSWSESIAALVRAFDDADHGVQLALTAAVQDTDLFDGFGNGFNAKAEGDIEKVEAREATKLAEKVRSGKKLDAKELAESQWLFRDVAQDKDASQTFLNNIGPDGTIELANRLNGWAYRDDKGHKSAYETMQAGLASTISTATADPKSAFYEKWRDGLREAGGKNFGSKTDPLYGYQSFVSLMGHGDRYGKKFLNDLGDDIIVTEKKHPGIWTQVRTRPDVEPDPLDHLLGIMSKNPDAATSFLDPGEKESNDHLKYLFKEREWPKRMIASAAGVHTYDIDTSKAGLGAAVEAAATGHAPLPDGARPDPEAKHTMAQARVMHDTIQLVDPGSSSAAPENLRRPLANALAEYSTDTHEILSGVSSYQDHDGVKNDGKVTMSVKEDTLLRTMRALSEDPEGYATLFGASSAHISNELDKLSPHDQGDDRNAPLNKSGAVLGSYTAIREDVINDARSASYSGADWKSKMAYHLLGGLVTPVTVGAGGFPIGDGLQRGVDTWAWAWSNDMKAQADSEANAKIADNYMDSQRQTRLMLKGWANGHGISESDAHGRNVIEGMHSEFQGGSTRGVEAAKRLLK
ncbi:hypothetical protein [Streptomyces mashuensis]|nr:hypothetical protein [Streptomyces mashuensis]